MSDVDDITTRVHDAIAMNVGLMNGPSHIVERAVEVAGQVRRRRRRRRAVVSALLVTAAVGTLGGVAVATRDDGRGITVTAGSSTTQSPPTTAALPDASAIVAHWDNACGVAPTIAPVAGLRFTIDVPAGVVQPGASVTSPVVLENTTDHVINFGTGMGTWYVTTPNGRVVGTSAGYARYTIGYGVRVDARSREMPSQPQGGFAANSGSCAGSEFTPPRPTPLPQGHYLAWFGIPSGAGTMFLSEPVPFEVAGGQVWDVPVTRAAAVAKGKDGAIDPTTAIVTAKLASWAEIRDAGAAMGTGPDDNPDRRVWAVSISGAPHPGMCCIGPHKPFRWGVVFLDASTGDLFSFNAGPTGDIAPWFAKLPDHGA